MDEKKHGWYPIKELKHDRWRVCYYNKGRVVYTIMKDYPTFEEAEAVCMERTVRVSHP